MKKKLILAFIGCFNPPTNGHYHAAALAYDTMRSKGFEIEKFLMIPAHDGYVKKGLLSSRTRIDMCSIICKDSGFMEVSSIEVDREKWTYTIETMRELQVAYPDNTIYIVCGADVVLSFETRWREVHVNEILSKFGLCILSREDGVEEVKKNCKFLKGNEENVTFVVDNPLETISSTLVRNYIKKGFKISGLVHPGVEKFIYENNLYKE